MIVDDHLLLWNNASLKIINFEKKVMASGEQFRSSKLSTSTFLYIIKGRARILLNDNEHIVELGYVCHTGTQTTLSISNVTDHLEYYIIQYKATMPLPCSQDLLLLLDQTRPFHIQYGFAFSQSGSQLAILVGMEQKWSQSEAMAKLQVKTLFYQFICELMKQLQHQKIRKASPNKVLEATAYIDKNYAEPITAESLAARLNCSPRTLQRMFKKRLSLGPIDYLLQVRINKSKELLSSTSAKLQDIALAIGYVDSYYFSRLFKRYTGVSPSTYREWLLHTKEDNAEALSDFSFQNKTASLNLAHSSLQRTIIHLKGELTLERPPEKIAVLDPQFMDHLLALDEQPAGSVIVSGDQDHFPNYLFGQLNKIQPLGTLNKPDQEALRSLAPDLIICTEFHTNIYNKLTQIAPTIMLKRNDDWREVLQVFGRILGKQLEVELVLQKYKHKISQLKSTLKTKLNGQSVSMIRPQDNNIRLHTCAHRTASILYNDLGLHPPKRAIDRTRTSSMIPLDGLRNLDADHYFVLIDNKFQSWSNEIQNTTTWKSLRAVQQHHIYHAKANMWIAYYGPIAVNRVVDQVAETLLNAK